MADELLSCPFCGGDANADGHVRYSRPLTESTWEDGSPITEAFFVNCIKCQAAIRSATIGGYQHRAQAIAAWNRRAILAEARKPDAATVTSARERMLSDPDIVAECDRLWRIAIWNEHKRRGTSDAVAIREVSEYADSRAALDAAGL